MKRIAESTVRRLSMYLRYLEELDGRGQHTASSDELATLFGTTPAQVRKDLSSFGSFGTRGLGYPVHELSDQLRAILGLGREWRVVIIGAGKIGAALANYHGFTDRGFRVVGVYDNHPAKIGQKWGDEVVRDMADLERDVTPRATRGRSVRDGAARRRLLSGRWPRLELLRACGDDLLRGAVLLVARDHLDPQHESPSSN